MGEWHMQPKRFEGVLSLGGDSVPVAFTAGIDEAGEVHIEFEPIPVTSASVFIQAGFEGGGLEFSEFSLAGVAEDSDSFNTSSISFTSLGSQSFFGAYDMQPVGSCSTCNFLLKVPQSEPAVLKILVKGFQGEKLLKASTPLGEIEMTGAGRSEDLDLMRGAIKLECPVGGDPEAWREEAGKLVDHVRHVMSFASGVMLCAPISEFVHGGVASIEAFSQSPQPTPYLAPFNSRDFGAIFRCAVNSYFEPAIDFRNLNFAIGWFVMGSLYSEANLISAMTVLENMISSNLLDADKTIQPEEGFVRLKAKLSAATTEHANEIFADSSERQQFRSDINEKYGELNRKSLKQKIDLLAHRWSVNLEGLTADQIKGAKRARDLVVHEGSYAYQPNQAGRLFEHVIVARELVVRFVLTGLGFEGKYYSYIGGWHEAEFLTAAGSGAAA